MHFTSAALVVASVAINQASATGGIFGFGGWGSPFSFSTPANTDNKCSTNQTNGYDWSGLSPGSFDSYGSNRFSGWSCSNSFGKRDLLSKRTFQSKCITSNLDDEPAVDCNGDDTMSIKTYQISSDQDEDMDIECHYTMPDDSVCKEVHTCASTGSTIQNTQCGGAKKVTFKPVGSFIGKGCNIGVHSIAFDCETASAPPSYSATSAPLESSTQATPYSLSTSVSSAASISTPAYGTASSEASSPTYSSASTSAPSYASSSSISASAPVYSPTSSVENSPVTASASNHSSPGSSVTPTSSVPVTTPNSPQPNSPDVLPKCINSWLHLTTCKDNTDYECFCKSGDFVSKVYSCVSAWSNDKDTTNSGAGYFMGLCAEYIPHNPAIVTGCPSSITPAAGYTPASSTPNSPVSGSPSASTGKTVTSTIVATITSCGADVANCPATSAHVQPSSSAVPSGTHSQPVQYSSSAISTGTHSKPVQSSSSSIVDAVGSTSAQSSSPAVPTSSASQPAQYSSSAIPTSTGPHPVQYPSSSLADAIGSTPMPYSSSAVPTGAGPHPVQYPSSSSLADAIGSTPMQYSSSAVPTSAGPHPVQYSSSSAPTGTGPQPMPYSSSAVPTGAGPHPVPYPSSSLADAIGSTPSQYSSSAVPTGAGPHPVQYPSSSSLADAIGSTPPAQYPSSATPAPSAGITSPPSIPCTTITFSSTWMVPATYSTGTNAGSPIPSSSSTTTYITTLTVPRVHMTTYTVTESGGSTHNVPGLGYQVPASATDVSPVEASASSSTAAGAANVTPPAPYAAPSNGSPAGGSSIGTTYVPAATPTSSITPYLGAGQKVQTGGLCGVVMVVAAMMAAGGLIF
ncbi:Adhesion cell surface protein [Sphaerulina musiva]